MNDVLHNPCNQCKGFGAFQVAADEAEDCDECEVEVYYRARWEMSMGDIDAGCGDTEQEARNRLAQNRREARRRWRHGLSWRPYTPNAMDRALIANMRQGHAVVEKVTTTIETIERKP